MQQALDFLNGLKNLKIVDNLKRKRKFVFNMVNVISDVLVLNQKWVNTFMNNTN